MAQKDLNKLLEKFNKLDVSPMTTRDYVLGLEQAKSGVKNLTQKEADKLFPDKLTDEDIDNLRAAREQEVAIKRGLISANEAKTVTKRTKAIANAGKPTKAGLQSLNFFKKEREEAKQREIDIEQIKKEFQPQAELVKKVSPQLKGYSSGVQNLPMLPESKESKNTSKLMDLENTANFDYDFLISTKGELNKEPLMDILISTWDETHSEEDLDELEKLKKQNKPGSSDDDGSGILDALLGMSFFDLFFDPIKKLSKNAFKRLRKIGRRVVNAIKKPFKKIINLFKSGLRRIKRQIKNLIKQTQRRVKNLLKVAKKQVKNMIKSAKASVKNMIKSAKSRAKAIVKRAKDVAKKLKNEAKQILKEAKNRAKQLLEKGKNKLKSGVNTVKKVAKKSAQKAKDVVKRVGKSALKAGKAGVSKVKNVAKKGLAKVSTKSKNIVKAGVAKSKNIAKNGIKLVKDSKAATALKTSAKAGAKSTGKEVAKGILKRVPYVSSAIDLGFMAYDVNEIQNETGGTVEQALDTYRDNLREEGHTWWEVIDPFRFGQQIALDLGIDKLAEKAVDWTMDTFSDSASEKMKKAQESANARKDELQANLQRWRENNANIHQPEEIENPDYRYAEQMQTPIPQTQVTLVTNNMGKFEGDGEDLPYYGFSYSGAY